VFVVAEVVDDHPHLRERPVGDRPAELIRRDVVALAGGAFVGDVRPRVVPARVVGAAIQAAQFSGVQSTYAAVLPAATAEPNTDVPRTGLADGLSLLVIPQV